MVLCRGRLPCSLLPVPHVGTRFAGADGEGGIPPAAGSSLAPAQVVDPLRRWASCTDGDHTGGRGLVGADGAVQAQLPGCRTDVADFAQQTQEFLNHRRWVASRRISPHDFYGPWSSPGRIAPAGPVMRGADVQSQLLGRSGDGASPVLNGKEVVHILLAVVARRPDPGSVRPLLARAPANAELLGRRGNTSQPLNGGKEILSLRTGMGLLGTLPRPRPRCRFSR